MSEEYLIVQLVPERDGLKFTRGWKGHCKTYSPTQAQLPPSQGGPWVGEVYDIATEIDKVEYVGGSSCKVRYDRYWKKPCWAK